MELYTIITASVGSHLSLKNMPVALVLLDLSAAFDTIDHNQLLHRLNRTWTGVALNCLSSYLRNRYQSVKVLHFQMLELFGLVFPEGLC